MAALVKTEFSNGLGRITLQRPEKRNALNRELLEQLNNAVVNLKSEPNLRVVVFAAAGTVFCAGMDLAEMQARANSPTGSQEWERDSEIYCDLLTKLVVLPVPTIAAVNGPVLAGGVGLVLACDLVVASEDVFFTLPEPKRGITAAIVTPLLVHRTGAGVAGQLLLSGEKMSAQRALQVGLCMDVVAKEQVAQRVEQLISAILSGSPAALAITKQHLTQCSGTNIVQQLAESIRISASARDSTEAREGLAAFLEKRQPVWEL